MYYADKLLMVNLLYGPSSVSTTFFTQTNTALWSAIVYSLKWRESLIPPPPVYYFLNFLPFFSKQTAQRLWFLISHPGAVYFLGNVDVYVFLSSNSLDDMDTVQYFVIQLIGSILNI